MNFNEIVIIISQKSKFKVEMLSSWFRCGLATVRLKKTQLMGPEFWIPPSAAAVVFCSWFVTFKKYCLAIFKEKFVISIRSKCKRPPSCLPWFRNPATLWVSLCGWLEGQNRMNPHITFHGVVWIIVGVIVYYEKKYLCALVVHCARVRFGRVRTADYGFYTIAGSFGTWIC